MIRVFIADDHTILRNGIRTLLSTAPDISVVGEAADGRAVLTAMETTECDVLLLDLSLPRVNGAEVLRRVSAGPKPVKTLVLSMYAEDQYGLRMLQAGAAGYLSKDRSEQELIAAIREVARGNRYVTPAVAEQMISKPGAEATLPHTKLTSREYQIFTLLAHGRTISDIAAELDLSAGTVSNHVFHIKEKLAVKSVGEIVGYAHRTGLVE
jgi:DNA-binding NarL/FixJ family response regulator